MLFDIVSLAIIAILIGIVIYLYFRQNKAFDQISKLVIELVKNDKKIEAIEQSTGSDIFLLRKEFEKFKTDYGEAAIEEMRQAARSEKAWADGVNSIMGYGAALQERGKRT